MKDPWDVADEVVTVADAVRIGREAAQQMIATATMLTIGDRPSADLPLSAEEIAAEVHLLTVETVSELTTAPVAPARDDETKS